MKKIALLFVALISISLAGCSFDKVENGDLVHVIFTGTFSDNTLFEAKDLKIIEGSGDIIGGLEEAIIGMKAGENKSIDISPEKGYGKSYSQTNIQKISKIIFDKLQISTDVKDIIDIAGLKGSIKGIEKDESGNEIVLFDTNKPETYKTIHYTINVISINE